ncbi:hypothetical protein D3C87_1705420 [compost metagenome]
MGERIHPLSAFDQHPVLRLDLLKNFYGIHIPGISARCHLQVRHEYADFPLEV